ncbi:MAG TPA: helix-turn-helix transcriptional regulator [Gordonia sp. (in: high G+C Gram-positive bacteria)]|uniref:heat shock protein transcriptional repressor HspR n=1 Tax=unclassified Gordonia (in: high G+C Gram-positive bacteria) TaxID=2657482 RepID=UPI000FBDA633|nr:MULTISPECIES: helix-turn-helix transcriptional regulator [unclassified Gordonia (in: high G+C Gram-positive bacteria)]RUP41173.1 MAG: MerR family transcriptional regulator [Gordonia sp. (in: high G+C Gram-positive bacteria)]HNP55637.1 helix-turn-helix transcriptional regulator [Gordonia sp. (in: high G+C Gram-positive bacteria)]HRC50769.1 helix-turn-helix transcriptional regulator [Gordonia sp. (in: high G+C Gram-positive bacteria)]
MTPASRKPGQGPEPSGRAEDRATYVISVAAELSGMHAQTLRTYDRLGLVTPARTSGGGRRYSSSDVELLREIQRLSQEEGVNLAGIKRIIELTREVDELRARIDEASRRPGGDPDRSGSTTALVVWQPRRGRRTP